MKVRIKKLDENAVIPKYAKAGDAGLDLTATSYHYDEEKECHVYGTGLAIQIPYGYVGLIFPRSSVCKYTLDLSNCVGVVDSGYRGEIKFFFNNKNTQKLDVNYVDMRTGAPVSSGELDKFPEEDKHHLVANAKAYQKVYKVGDRVGQIILMPYPQVELEEVEELSGTERGDGAFGSSGE